MLILGIGVNFGKNKGEYLKEFTLIYKKDGYIYVYSSVIDILDVKSSYSLIGEWG